MILAPLLVYSTAFAADPLPYEVHERTLDNGLRVVAVQTASEGVVALRTWFSVGSRDETRPGQTGYAHFFEHLMFHGTESRPRGSRKDQLVAMGAQDNAWTWFDETVYTTLLPAEELDALLATEADRFQALALTKEGVRREAGAVYGEFRKGQSDPGERLGDTLWATAFPTHTYGHSTIGHEADIAGMPEGHSIAAGFLAEFYRPDRATILLVGDVEPNAALDLVASHFGEWAAAEVAEASPPIAPEPDQTEIRRATVEWATTTAPRLAMGWRIPAHDPASEDLALLDLLASFLSSRTGPLHAALVEPGLALRVRASRSALVDPSLFTIQVHGAEGADLAAIETAIRTVLTEVSGESLADVRTHRLNAQRLRMEHPAQLADGLGWQLRRSGQASGLATWLETTRTADLDRLPALIADTFTDSGLSVVTLEGP